LIIETAASLFAKKGYVETTLRDVMKALGISAAAYYYYFDSKEAVLLEILDRMATRVEANLRHLEPRPGVSPVQSVATVIASHAREVAMNASAAAVLFGQTGRRNRSKGFDPFRKRMRTYTDALVLFYAEGVKRGDFAESDPRLGVYSLVGMANWVAEWYDPRPQPSPDAIATAIGLLTARAIAPQLVSSPTPAESEGRSMDTAGPPAG
jgi:AcrR family transcriptional regulator